MTILSDRVNPKRSEQIEQGLRAGRASETLTHMTPADTFYLTAEFQRRYPKKPGPGEPRPRNCRSSLSSTSGTGQLEALVARFWRAASQPGSNLWSRTAECRSSCLLPGYSSRFLAESWDSPNLYWARLADEAGQSPVTLNHLVPRADPAHG